MPRSSVVELRIMPPLHPENDVTAYLVIEDFGHLGRAYRETDLAEADHDTIVRNMISGEYSDPLRVVALDAVEGWCRDVSEEIAYDVLDRAYDADTTLSPGAKRFIRGGATLRYLPKYSRLDGLYASALFIAQDCQVI
jgi:hypothetical protein